ncbi:MAG: TonB family protein [Gammaproteobacteria bacterium]|nr:TonB family protein [Gammaproteobacteria bacterium]
MKKSRNYFILALLLHLLLFTSVSVSLLSPPSVEPYQSSSDVDSNLVLPAYVYHEEKNEPTPDAIEKKMAMPAIAQPEQPQAQEKSNPNPKPDTSNGFVEKQDSVSDDTIALKKQDSTKTAQSSAKSQPTPTDKPSAVDQKASKKNNSKQHETQDIATKKGVDNLLLKLLSQATAAKLVYPKIAEDFRLRGTVKLKFLLFPDGRITQVSLVESSGSTVLDSAAMDTIRAISPVHGVDKYLQSPKIIQAGIIYGTEKSRQFESYG